MSASAVRNRRVMPSRRDLLAAMDEVNERAEIRAFLSVHATRVQNGYGK